MAETRFILKQIPNGPETAIVGVTTVGRNEDNTLRLAETKISRYHARLTLKQTVVFVEDLGSANGTFINDTRIEANKPRQLHTGDRLRFDRDEFEFRAPVQDSSNKTEMRPAEGPTRPASWIEDPEGKHTVFIAPTPKKQSSAKAPAPVSSAAIGHSPGDAPYLLISTGAKSGSKIEMPVTAAAKQTWTIGGQGDRNICLTEAGVSAIHATLRRDASAWQLTDDLSVNGTFVNDTKILQCFLSDGDRIRFGPLECVFRIPPPAAKSSGGGARLKNVAVLVAAAFLVTLAAIFAAYKFGSK
jgi:pSer/pThr/pTyr-binding forkhead associated (FHA) protein